MAANVHVFQDGIQHGEVRGNGHFNAVFVAFPVGCLRFFVDDFHVLQDIVRRSLDRIAHLRGNEGGPYVAPDPRACSVARVAHIRRPRIAACPMSTVLLSKLLEIVRAAWRKTETRRRNITGAKQTVSQCSRLSENRVLAAKRTAKVCHSRIGTSWIPPVPLAGRTLDTGALIALEKHRKGMTKVVEAARQGRVSITVPSNAVTEWWRGRTDRRDHVRRMFVIKDVGVRIDAPSPQRTREQLDVPDRRARAGRSLLFRSEHLGTFSGDRLVGMRDGCSSSSVLLRPPPELSNGGGL